MQIYPEIYKKGNNSDDLYNICVGIICGSLCCIIIMVIIIIIINKDDKGIINYSGSY
jgi:hypothetical protein